MDKNNLPIAIYEFNCIVCGNSYWVDQELCDEPEDEKINCTECGYEMIFVAKSSVEIDNG